MGQKVSEVVRDKGGELLALIESLAESACERDAVDEEVRLRYIAVRLQMLLEGVEKANG